MEAPTAQTLLTKSVKENTAHQADVSSQRSANGSASHVIADKRFPTIRRSRQTRQGMAKVYPLKTGKYGVFVTLKTPLDLKGCKTSGRKKFELSTEAAANSLAVEINTLLLGKEPARSLTEEQLRWAKQLFWEHLAAYPDWAPFLRELVAHAVKTGFRPPQKNDHTVAQAIHIFFEEKVADLEYESWMNYRNSLAYALPAFGSLKTTQFTEDAVVKLARGSEQLQFLKCTGHRTQTKEQRQEALWSKEILSKSKRPWTPSMMERFLRCMRAFKTWMHSSIDPQTNQPRNWCQSWQIEREGATARKHHRRRTKLDTEILDAQCLRNPALTVPQCQSLIDVAWHAYDGKFAPFYVHGMFGGTRVKETKLTKSDAFDLDDGTLTIGPRIAKTDQGRENELSPNIIVMIEMLRTMELYEDCGMCPTQLHRTVIAILAGFESNNKVALHFAEKERLRLVGLGINLPKNCWGVQLPKNALRRTGLSMHYKLYNSVARTTEWAGNTPKVFKDYYKRLVKKEDARYFWTLIPTVIQKRLATPVPLPRDHELDSIVSSEVKQTLVAATSLARQIKDEALVAAERLSQERREVLRLQTLVYRKRGYLKQKAAKELQLRAKLAEGAVGFCEESQPLVTGDNQRCPEKCNN